MTRVELSAQWAFIEVSQTHLGRVLEQRSEALLDPGHCPCCGRTLYEGEGYHLLDFGSSGVCCSACAERVEVVA